MVTVKTGLWFNMTMKKTSWSETGEDGREGGGGCSLCRTGIQRFSFCWHYQEGWERHRKRQQSTICLESMRQGHCQLVLHWESFWEMGWIGVHMGFPKHLATIFNRAVSKRSFDTCRVSLVMTQQLESPVSSQLSYGVHSRIKVFLFLFMWNQNIF